jgi:hypothetical protein
VDNNSKKLCFIFSKICTKSPQISTKLSQKHIPQKLSKNSTKLFHEMLPFPQKQEGVKKLRPFLLRKVSTPQNLFQKTHFTKDFKNFTKTPQKFAILSQ